ncbi:2-dehydropantoate 2-reductase [Paraliobacillus quinghaiensis]|uniref:2-dehydropantoate 2-reductase n=1 Tax=Paraliobacillus quinghaiensis TaxID=470815 RepID=A0A917TEI3_9BACI|nr:2-dehydropantoate 2-reductase [Paraliobacillus quinghaiensis]GGM20519.1 2-dehydropantoate 2-reductase [Paraliobacillus quinghaiensis]
MKIGVVGGGAIGLLLAGLLTEQSHDVTLYVRNEVQKNQINQKGIICLPEENTYNPRALLIDELEQEELIFICVKQYDVEKLLPKLEHSCSTLVFLQNGMSHIDALDHFDYSNTIIIGTCEHAARKVNATTVRYTGEGKLNLALFKGDQKDFEHLNNHVSDNKFPIVLTGNWRHMLHNKLIINSVINPITAVFQVKNGALLSNPHLLYLAQSLCKEVANELKLNEQEQWERIRGIIEKTTENDSSMKTDIENNRKTEIDGILGYLLQHSDNPKPLINNYYHAIKALEMEGV